MDYIISATDSGKEVSVYVAKTTDMVETVRDIHKPTPVVCAAIGRAVTATSIMGFMMKGEKNKISLIIKGDGLIGNITCTGNSKGYVKACATNYDVDIPIRETDGKLDVGRAVGSNGILTVIRDLGLKEPYVGHNSLVNGEIAQDLTSYFVNSEQVASSVGLGVLVDTDYTVKHAGGFIVLLMPFAKEETISKLEDNIKNIRSITSLMEDDLTPEDIAQLILKDLGCVILSKNEVKYECDCSRKRIEEALISIGKKELQKIYEEDKKAEICCHFCNKKYYFDEEELKSLIDHIK